MAQLPHIKNSVVAQQIAEPVVVNRFQAAFAPPAGIVVPATLAQEVKSIAGLDAINKLPEIVRQKSAGSDRIFMNSFVDDSSIELTFTINLNAHGAKANDVLIYKMFKAWARRGRDERTGQMSLKKDYVGGLQLEQHNVIGEIWRSIGLQRGIISAITGLDEVNIETGEPVVLTVTIVFEQYKVVEA